MATDDSEKAAARELSTEAKTAYDDGQFDEAMRKFQLAYDIAKVPTLAVWTARSLVMRGQLVAASELYRQAGQLTANDLWIGDSQQLAQADAQKELNALIPRIPRIRILIQGATVNDVEVTINGSKLLGALVGVDRLTDPGHWTVVGKRGSEVVERAIDLNEGERMEVMLKFNDLMLATSPIVRTPKPLAQTASTSDASTSHSSMQRTWGWIATGVGATGLVAGAVTGFVVMSKRSNLDCPNNTCDPSKVSAGSVNSFNTMRTVSTVSFVVGGTATATGITLLLSSPKQQSRPSLGLLLSPAATGVQGAF